MKSGVSLLLFEPHIFNIFIWDLFFDDIDIDLSNYADDTTPYAYDLENGKVIKLLEKLVDWFSGNFLKANFVSVACL